MLESRVESIIRNVILKTSKSTGLSLVKLRIKLKLSENLKGVEFHAMNESVNLGEINWVSHLSFLEKTFEKTIVNTLIKNLEKIANENNIENKNVNVRIYPMDDKGAFKLMLNNEGKRLKYIEIKDLV